MTDGEIDLRPMSEQVYDTLRRQIADGTRPARTRLVQEQIAAELSTSRTPVREALGRLAQSGLVTWVPGRGFLVSAVQEREVRDVQGVRAALEVAALTEAIPKYTRVDIERLRLAHQEMVDADASTDHFALTRRFHQALVGPCPNKLLLKYLEDAWSLPVNMKVTGKYTARNKSVAVMLRDHAEIIDALESADPSTAIDLLRAHISNVYPDDLSSSAVAGS